jgi:hypothetical protein
MTADATPTGQDTATGTDPDAKYDQPGYEDKSFGQAVNQDMETVETLVAESGGDVDAAEERFKTESAGAPALARQNADDSADGRNTPTPSPGKPRTGEAQAEENRENDPPA